MRLAGRLPQALWSLVHRQRRSARFTSSPVPWFVGPRPCSQPQASESRFVALCDNVALADILLAVKVSVCLTEVIKSSFMHVAEVGELSRWKYASFLAKCNLRGSPWSASVRCPEIELLEILQQGLVTLTVDSRKFNSRSPSNLGEIPLTFGGFFP